ncbi:hypothetical protein TWF481_008055 [Arthrobotrys musiformis]|uniref:Uncharacterized protein n=1 Tax=Arthrobotrys musiformis TaxID=47236 RepID=A0AAV9W8J6_9PEZI
MRRFKPRHPPVLCRPCAFSTSSTPQASALRIAHHPTSTTADPSIRPSSSEGPRGRSEVWLTYNQPLRPPAPITAAPVEEKVLGISYIPRKDNILSALSTRTVNGLIPTDGLLLSSANAGSEGDTDPVSERTLNLGKTIDILKDHLPTLLQSPLPSEILSPSITLQLFPSTHPNLPSVSGRVAYVAALWSSPMAWGRIPGIKVRLEILSIRMIPPAAQLDDEPPTERMIVKWKASGSPNGTGDTPQTTSSPAATEKNEDPLSAVANSLPKFTLTGGFCGLFIFEFDEKGRIKTHIIEDVEEDRDEAVQQHSTFITLTEWLLKKAKKSLEEKQSQVPGLAFGRIWDGDIKADQRFSTPLP